MRDAHSTGIDVAGEAPAGRLRDTPAGRPACRPAGGVETYRADRLYPRIVRAVDAILQSGKVVAPVDVLVGMRLLAPDRLEDWRCGRVPFLEQAIETNLARLSLLLRSLRFHAHDLNLVPSATAYMRRGKGPTQRLRFTKTGDARLEAAHAMHFVWPGKGPFHAPRARAATHRHVEPALAPSDVGSVPEVSTNMGIERSAATEGGHG